VTISNPAGAPPHLAADVVLDARTEGVEGGLAGGARGEARQREPVAAAQRVLAWGVEQVGLVVVAMTMTMTTTTRAYYNNDNANCS